MNQFTADDLKRLVENTDKPVASIYMPTHRAGREVNQNAIRFKNVMTLANQHLTERFAGEHSLEAQLQEAAKLETDDEWWQHQSDGLAMFLTADRFDRYRLPLDFDESVTVGRRFYVRPMIRLLQGDGRFYVLAVSQNRVRLLEGTHYSVDELDPAQLPSDLRTALNIDEYTSALQQHSTGKPDAGSAMTFHGHGGSDMDVQKQDEIRQFFHQISAAMDSYFGAERTPLVFSGVDYLFPIFRDTCHYNGLIEQAVSGNPDELRVEDLHRQAWGVVEPRFTAERDAAVQRFRDASGSLRGTAELNEIIRAARQGAIDTLLLAEDQRQWGVVDVQTDQMQPTDENADDAEELFNHAAVYTLTNGGTVYSLPYDRMPDGKQAAALLRFPLPSR